MNIDITGWSIERLSLDYAVTLLTDGGAEIRIESAFRFITPTGEVVVVHPETPGDGANGLAAILHERFTEATVIDKTGTLLLEISNCTRLEAASNESYEAWTFTRADGLKVVALPGARVTIRGPEV